MALSLENNYMFQWTKCGQLLWKVFIFVCWVMKLKLYTWNDIIATYVDQCVCGWVLSIAKLGKLFWHKVSQVHTELTCIEECNCKIEVGAQKLTTQHLHID